MKSGSIVFQGAGPLVALGLAIAPLSVLQAAGPLDKIGKGEGKVDIVAWPGYIERGQTDKRFDWVTDFEKATGCMVSVKTAGTSDEMVAALLFLERNGGVA